MDHHSNHPLALAAIRTPGRTDRSVHPAFAKAPARHRRLRFCGTQNLSFQLFSFSALLALLPAAHCGHGFRHRRYRPSRPRRCWRRSLGGSPARSTSSGPPSLPAASQTLSPSNGSLSNPSRGKQAPTRVGDSLGDGRDAAGTDSWLRLRDMAESAVMDDDTGREIQVVPGNPSPRLRRRPAAGAAGYFARTGTALSPCCAGTMSAWQHGVRDPKGLLGSSHSICARHSGAAGCSLCHLWRLDRLLGDRETSQDIGYVEENPETYAAFLKACCLGSARRVERKRLKG